MSEHIAPLPPRVDFDDTTSCPLGCWCECCGRQDRPLVVLSVPTELGTLCMTICTFCSTVDQTLPFTEHTVAKLVAEHAEHLAGGAR